MNANTAVAAAKSPGGALMQLISTSVTKKIKNTIKSNSRLTKKDSASPLYKRDTRKKRENTAVRPCVW